MSDAVSDFVLGMVCLGSGSTVGAPPPFEAQDWKRALEFSTDLHAMLPYLTRIEGSFPRAEIPAEIVALHSNRMSRERMLLALLDEELERSLAILHDAGTPVIVLKGMDLGRRFYPSRMLRPMTDVDLLVPRGNMGRALAAMNRAGYAAIGPSAAKRFRIELSRHKAGPVVELHSALLAGDTPEELGAIWTRSADATIPGLPAYARALGAEDCLAYLIRHAAIQHALESPVWVNDVHFLIERHTELDWAQVTGRILAKNAQCGAWLMLTLLEREWNTPVPAPVLSALAEEIGRPRRLLLSRMARLSHWFSLEPRTYPWVLRTRYLLRGGPGDAVAYGIRRIVAQA